MLFRDIPGHDSIKQRLLHSVANQRVSHTQLLLGPEGTGKLALAIAFARYIHCSRPGTSDACGECPSCIKYRKLVHPDLHFVFPVAKIKDNQQEVSSDDYLKSWRELLLSQNGIISYSQWAEHAGFENKKAIINTRDCNEIHRRLSYKSMEAEYKILILWLVEKVFHSAAHKLLKVLEEPPEKTLFILVSENQDLILPTILSRTQLVKVPRFTDAEIREALVRKLGISGEHAAQLAILAEGNLVAAQNMASETDEFTNYFKTFRDWLRYCFKYNYNPDPSTPRNAPIITQLLQGFEAFSPEKQKQFLIFGLRLLRSCLLVSLGKKDLVNFTGEELEFAGKFSGYVNTENIGQYQEAFQNALSALDRNGKPSIVFITLTIKVMALLNPQTRKKNG